MVPQIFFRRVTPKKKGTAIGHLVDYRMNGLYGPEIPYHCCYSFAFASRVVDLVKAFAILAVEGSFQGLQLPNGDFGLILLAVAHQRDIDSRIGLGHFGQLIELIMLFYFHAIPAADNIVSANPRAVGW
jgi:hypothetical protein